MHPMGGSPNGGCHGAADRTATRHHSTRERRWRCHAAQGLIVAVLLLATAAGGQEPTVELHAGAADAKGAKEIAVLSEGTLPVTVSVSAGKDKKVPPAVDVEVTPFTGNHAGRLSVLIEVPKGKPVARQTLALKDGVARFYLVVGVLDTDERYTGAVLVETDNSVLKAASYTLFRADRAREATLVVDEHQITVEHERSPFPSLWRKEPRATTVHLFDKDRRWAIKGVYAQIVESTSPKSTFDPTSDVELKMGNGGNLWRWPPVAGAEEKQAEKARDIPEGGIAPVACAIRDLPAGEHIVKLRFGAQNSKNDDGQLLTVKVLVKDSLWWATCTLLLAIATSYVATRWLADRRRAIQLRSQIAELSAPWLAREPAVLPVVWARSMLRQAEDRCRTRVFLLGADTIQQRIDDVKPIMGILKRISMIRGRIDGLGVDAMIKLRAHKVLRQIVSGIGEGPIDTQMSTEVSARLDHLESWFGNDLNQNYEASLGEDIEGLRRTMSPAEMKANAKAEVERLWVKLDNETDAVKKERIYAALKILWERRAESELAGLVALSQEDVSIERIFEFADNAAWDRLQLAKEQDDAGAILLKSPRPGALEAYQPLRFEIAPAIPELGQNYLFLHGLEFNWRIEMKRRWHESERQPLEPVSAEPQVVQYAPCRCSLVPTVSIRYRDRPPLRCSFQEELRVGPPRDSGILRALASVEALSLSFAVGFALLSGLGAMYIGKPTFGGLGSYITLFLWGAGVDQSKNFISHLASLRSGGGKT